MCLATSSMSAGNASFGISAKFIAAYFMRIMQRGPAQAASHGLDENGAVAVRQNDATHADETGFDHGVANDGKGFLSDEVARDDVIRRVIIPRVELLMWKEAVKLDSAVVLKPRWGSGGGIGGGGSSTSSSSSRFGVFGLCASSFAGKTGALCASGCLLKRRSRASSRIRASSSSCTTRN